MAAEVHTYAQGCEVCQRNSGSQSQKCGKLVPLPIPGDEWDFVTADRITHLPETDKGHTAILVVMDKLTKMVHFAPCRDDDNAERMAELFVENVYKLHGSPLEVLTDRGTEFCNKFADAVLKIVGTLHHKTTAYHPQSNGQTERMNRVLEDMLRHYVNPRQTNWDTLLPVLEFAVNNTWQESIGNTPFFLNYGRHPRTPAALVLPSENPAAEQFVTSRQEALDKAKSSLEAAQQRYKAYADGHLRDVQFAVGDKVLLSTQNIPLKGIGTKELTAKFIGPFDILQRVGLLVSCCAVLCCAVL